MASRKKLPNLKISVDNTQSSDESDVEVGVSDASSYDGDNTIEVSNVRTKVRLEDGEVHEEDENDVLSISAAEPTERRFLTISSLRQDQEAYGPRVYENKTGNFVTGVDITSEEATEKREKRAQRFGTLSTPKQPITDVDIKNLYKSLGMSTDTLDQDLRGWRTDAILLRGTENMSTKDVFEYFTDYAPKGVEWIDDFSCNVLWQDKLTPARALIKLSLSMEEVGSTQPPLEEDGNNFHGISPLNRDKQKENPESVAVANKNVTDEISASGTTAVTSVPERTKVQPTPAVGDRENNEPVLNVLEEAMELDYDDNLDLTEEDPIDKALSTWANLSQNKKVKAERAKETERKKSEIPKERAKTSQKERIYQEVVVKEEKDFSGKSGSRNIEVGQKGRNVTEFEAQNQIRPVNSKTTSDKSSSSKGDRSKSKSKAAEGNKSTTKKNDKMDTTDESDSDSSSSGSSSSSSGSSSSSSSGSSSTSGSDSESGSKSSSASSVDTVKAKKRKSRERRDKENEVRKNSRRAAPPPILPQAKEKADIPWPPGWWRLGVPYSKAKYLFLRYAMKADKKLPGAEKRSQYYVKYGNPNFGGIVGLISKSRKRRLRNVDKEEPVEEDVDSLEVVKTEENLEGAQSRLAGRVGTRAESGGSRRRDTEEETDKPRLKAGRDLRDLLNRDVSAVQHDPADKTEANNDSDDEMDYGAELERLMGDDAPPAKKRFMRMHADDEEEKIQAKRLLNVRKDTSKWPRGDYVDEDDVEEDEDVEAEEIIQPRRKEWVDYDNVEDDDPFNLFGTSRQAAAPKNVVDNDDDDDDEEEEHDDNAGYGRNPRRDGSSDNRTGRDVRQRLGASDLRAKIQGLKRVNNRTW